MTILDREGVDVPVGEVGHISKFVEEIRSEEPGLFVVGGAWSIEVVDLNGCRLGSISL
jgi:hypothetical protein